MRQKHYLSNTSLFVQLVLTGYKWADILKASDTELELVKLLWDNQHKIDLEDWDMYISRAEYGNTTTFDTEARIEIFRQVFVNVDGHHSLFGDYRINRN